MMQYNDWFRVAHVAGFTMWIAGLVGVATLVATKQRHALATVLLDAGATLALVFGLLMAFASSPSHFKMGSWLHLKSTLVVLGMIVPHVMLRRTLRLQRTKAVDLPGWVVPTMLVAAALIITLGAQKQLLRLP